MHNKFCDWGIIYEYYIITNDNINGLNIQV